MQMQEDSHLSASDVNLVDSEVPIGSNEVNSNDDSKGKHIGSMPLLYISCRCGLIN